MAGAVFSVSQISAYIKRIFEQEAILRPVNVKGEISTLRFSKHLYASLKDGDDSLECIMYSSKINDTARNLAIGDKVIFSGYIQAYTPASRYSLVINSIEYEGEGDYYKAFEELKRKLNEEGLFDERHKKPLPQFPKLIGIVTSENGAAIDDITKTLKNRGQMGDVILFPVPVQGALAGKIIADTIYKIDEEYSGKIDLLIVGRGGGSPEDLACFNDESLARAIFNCSIPVISAVGHEIDYSISDFVADVRAETPTAAANLAIRSNDELIQKMNSYLADLNSSLSGYIMQSIFTCDGLFNSIEMNLNQLIGNYEHELEKHILLLNENDPRKFLEKGYALVKTPDGKPISSAGKIKSGKDYSIIFHDGEADVIGK